MTVNVGTTDRVVRLVLAAVALVVADLVGFGSVGGIILIVVAVILALTSLVRFCPLYRLFNLSTSRRSS